MRQRSLSLIGVAAIAVSSLSAQQPAATLRKPVAHAVPASPEVTRIQIPSMPGPFAIWGSTGQDSRGHIWFGVSAAYTPVPSAHLFEYDPATGAVVDRGNVIDELRRAGVLKPGEHQAKIHSRIVQGPDGFLYFSSMDEEGENENGSKLPVWGGHLWRLRLSTGRWEHLAATPEALIAVAGGGRYIYSLGYFGHVLYRFDTGTGLKRRLEIGSVDGHISRNFVVDDRGHAYVPRLKAIARAGGRTISVSLVELGATFEEVHETALAADSYLAEDDATGSHGIVAFQTLPDRSIVFITHMGVMYRIVPPPAQAVTGRGVAAAAAAAAVVTPVGWFDPEGPMYVPSLFLSADGTRLYGLAHRRAGFQWLSCALSLDRCDVAPLGDVVSVSNALLYGSSTRDSDGAHYVVGMGPAPGSASGAGPIVLKIRPPAAP